MKKTKINITVTLSDMTLEAWAIKMGVPLKNAKTALKLSIKLDMERTLSKEIPSPQFIIR